MREGGRYAALVVDILDRRHRVPIPEDWPEEPPPELWADWSYSPHPPAPAPPERAPPGPRFVRSKHLTRRPRRTTERHGGATLLARELTEQVIDLAIEVHRGTGPGMLESVYEGCLCNELGQAGIAFGRRVGMSVIHNSTKASAPTASWLGN